MALSSNMICGMWWPGSAILRKQRRATAGTIGSGAHIFQSAVVMAVDGVAWPVSSGATMQARCLKYTGGDANSHLYISARRAGVRVALTSGAAESIAFTLGTTLDIAITYNNGTSTPNSLLDLIRSNGRANELLRASTSGTGAGVALVAVLIAAGVVPFIEMLGVSPLDIDNSAGGSPALPGEALFTLGGYAMFPLANAVPIVDGVASIVDDDTISKVAFGTDLSGTVLGQTADGVFYFLDLESVR